MWSTQTGWFDVAVVMTIFAIGNIFFGHFEEHRAKSRRVLKVVLVTGFVAVASALGFRWVGYSLLGALAVAGVYVHGWWLPSRGVNGLTGEPKAKYYELLGVERPSTGEARGREE